MYLFIYLFFETITCGNWVCDVCKTITCEYFTLFSFHHQQIHCTMIFSIILNLVMFLSGESSPLAVRTPVINVTLRAKSNLSVASSYVGAIQNMLILLKPNNFQMIDFFSGECDLVPQWRKLSCAWTSIVFEKLSSAQPCRM